MQVSNPDILINLQDYDIDQLLCQRAFIADFLAKDRKHGREVVIKNLYRYTEFAEGFTEKESFFRNICYFSEFDFPGIVKIFGVRFPLTEDEKRDQPQLIQKFQLPTGGTGKFDFSGFLYSSEYLPYGNLEALTKDYINNHGVSRLLNPTVRSKILFGVAATMKRIHELNFFHGNLKLDNIFLDENVEPRIADFQVGHLFYTSEDPSHFEPYDIANPKQFECFDHTIPPEFIEDISTIHDKQKFDVYSYAFLIYTMFVDKLEFDEKKPVRSPLQYIMAISRGARPKPMHQIPIIYWDLIQMCWEQFPENRPSFEQITQLLRSDDYAIEEFGQTTDLNALHEYWDRIDPVDNQ